MVLNGEHCDCGDGETVAGALARFGVAQDARGVAVAVDGEVVPRREWSTRTLTDGARVEVLTAMQGG
ncbi:MAG: sulfur carrier protein ThiS [Solirubrobacteraceae bacterium]